MRKALESLIDAVTMAGGMLSTEMLQGDVYNFLEILDKNNIRFHYAGPTNQHADAGKMFPVPLEPANGHAVLTVKFERETDVEELETMAENFKSGKIGKNPDTDFLGAVVAQFVLEMQQAYDITGIAGHFEVAAIETGVAFDMKRLAARRADK